MEDDKVLYKLMKKLNTPFKKWRAYKNGIIDENGNILKSRESFANRNEKDSFTKFDLFALQLKLILDKNNNAEEIKKSYTKTINLIKEKNLLSDEIYIEKYLNNIESLLEEVPVNSVSSGGVSPLGNGETPPKIIKQRILSRIKKVKKDE